MFVVDPVMDVGAEADLVDELELVGLVCGLRLRLRVGKSLRVGGFQTHPGKIVGERGAACEPGEGERNIGQ